MAPPPQNPRPRRERFTKIIIPIGKTLVGIATILGVLAAWPDNWWPRQPPEPKIFVHGVQEGSDYVVPQPSSNLTQPPKRARFACQESHRDWLKSLGAIPRLLFIDFLVTTENPESVTILAIRPEVRPVAAPEMQTNVRSRSAHGGPDGPPLRRAEVEVDRKPPTVKLYGEDGRRAERMNLHLRKGEGAQIILHAITSKVFTNGQQTST